MTHNGIRVLAAVALAATTALGTGVPAPAAAVSGQAQLVAVDQWGSLEHTIRYADGNWQPMRYITGYQGVSALTSVIVDGAENIFVQYDNGGGPTLGHLIRYPDGSWNTAASTPAASAASPATDLAVANVNGRLDLIRLDANGPMVSELGSNGQWSFWQPVPTNGKQLRAVAATADGNTLRVVELSLDGKYVGVADRQAAGWTSSTWKVLPSGRPTGTQVAAAQVSSDLQVGIAYGDPTDINKTYDMMHTILDRTGAWADLGYLHQALDPTSCIVQRVALAAVNGELQVACVNWTGGLQHTIRHPDGTWQRAGDVLAATNGDATGGFVTIAGG